MEIAVDLPDVGYTKQWQSRKDKPLTASAVDIMLKDGTVHDGYWCTRQPNGTAMFLKGNQCQGWFIDGELVDWELVHGWKYKSSVHPYNRNFVGNW